MAVLDEVVELQAKGEAPESDLEGAESDKSVVKDASGRVSVRGGNDLGVVGRLVGRHRAEGDRVGEDFADDVERGDTTDLLRDEQAERRRHPHCRQSGQVRGAGLRQGSAFVTRCYCSIRREEGTHRHGGNNRIVSGARLMRWRPAGLPAELF